MKIHIIGDKSLEAVQRCETVCKRFKVELTDFKTCEVAIAPYLTKKLTKAEMATPKIGILVFHPSLLPTRRGGDAIKWAYKHGDNITGVTWFWADEKMDGGAICSQEAFPLDKSITPREHYNTKVIPAMARTLLTALWEFNKSYYRRVQQEEQNATFDFKIKSDATQ